MTERQPTRTLRIGPPEAWPFIEYVVLFLFCAAALFFILPCALVLTIYEVFNPSSSHSASSGR